MCHKHNCITDEGTAPDPIAMLSADEPGAIWEAGLTLRSAAKADDAVSDQ